VLDSPLWEKQDWNNCGPASLSIYLRYYGWNGDQFDISNLIKPERKDRNVNIEELLYYTSNYAGWSKSLFRVGGDIQMLKGFIAAGIPVMVEESMEFEAPFWINDDLWSGHYLLLTSYDDGTQAFIGQDSYNGADKQVDYETLDANWKSFNRIFVLIYLPEMERTVETLLGQHWDVDYNRHSALDAARMEAEENPEDSFAWFNIGTNLVYFEEYEQAAVAYDTARNLGLPQRMLRYQFGPFFAYFHAGRNDDLLAVTDYALRITSNSEEALLWHGWARYRMGDSAGAIEDFRAAYWANLNSPDAQYALDFMGATP
jgi:tetratricopeptide (TPR) repeat protein